MIFWLKIRRPSGVEASRSHFLSPYILRSRDSLIRGGFLGARPVPNQPQINPKSTPAQPPARFRRVLCGGSEMLTGPVDRDFRTFWELLGALLASCLLRSFFCSSSKLLGSILSSQEGSPTLKNRAPASAAARFLFAAPPVIRRVR